MKTLTRIATLAWLTLCVAGVANAGTFTVPSTGIGTNGAVLGQGTVDPSYTITQINGESVNQSAYVSNGLAGGWIPNSSTQQWISPSSNGNDGFPSVTYVYQTTFNFTGSNPSLASITGILAADDQITKILLNGVQVVGSLGTYTQSSKFNITSGIKQGQNTLKFFVYNSGGGPTGLSVSMVGNDGSPISSVPEPQAPQVFVIGASILALCALGRKRAETPRWA